MNIIFTLPELMALQVFASIEKIHELKHDVDEAINELILEDLKEVGMYIDLSDTDDVNQFLYQLYTFVLDSKYTALSPVIKKIEDAVETLNSYWEMAAEKQRTEEDALGWSFR
jgi:hypothetical protein